MAGDEDCSLTRSYQLQPQRDLSTLVETMSRPFFLLTIIIDYLTGHGHSREVRRAPL